MTDTVWIEELEAAAIAFRLGMEAQGCQRLGRFVDALLPLLSGISGEKLVSLNGVLSETLAAQGRKDYLWAADLLEYEIAPLLKRIL